MLARKATRLLSSAESSKRSLTTRGSPFGRSKPSSGLMSSGLLGLPNVKTPRDWQRSAAQTINVCEGFIEDLVKNKSNDPVEVRPFFRLAVLSELMRKYSWRKRLAPLDSLVSVVRGLDRVSDTICSIADAAELCANVHPDPAWITGADTAIGMLSEYLNKLNTSQELYELASFAVNSNDKLTEEQLLVAQQLKIEFEHNGVHLPNKRREELYLLQGRIQELSMELRTLINDEGNHKSFDIPKEAAHQLPKKIQAVLSKFGDSYSTPADSTVIDSILVNVKDSEIRRRAFVASNSFEDHLSKMESLLKARQEIAEMLEFPSYSHMTSWHRILKSPDQVLSFLDDVSAQVKPKAQEELAQLKLRKMQMEPTNPDTHIRGWDYPYYKHQIQSEHNFASSSAMLPYFQLDNCINGIFELSNTLFGLKFHFVEPDHGEVWHSSVKKVHVADADGALLGYLYLDLYSRAHKFGGSANFPIRLKSSHHPFARFALVTNFEPATKSSATLLTHMELETLLHEWGHSMQAFLSSTELQNFSGTRSYIDFVEAVSLLFEHFAWDHRFLSTFAKNYVTGDVIPEALVEASRTQHRLFAGLGVQQQIFYAALDQHLHSGPHVLKGDTKKILQSLQSKYWGIPYAEGTSWHARFGHLIGYGAAYYTYLYSGVSSASIWQKLFAQNPLSKEAGLHLRNELLAYAGARDPSLLIKNLVGKEPDPADWIADKLGNWTPTAGKN